MYNFHHHIASCVPRRSTEIRDVFKLSPQSAFLATMHFSCVIGVEQTGLLGSLNLIPLVLMQRGAGLAEKEHQLLSRETTKNPV